MRMLFNHGLTIPEIYTNTPKTITSKNWKWFITQYGATASYSDALSDPFKYTIGLILNYVLDNRVRFIIPGVSEAYIDFEIVTEDQFEAHRQIGRFQDIDFIESDFTGYALRYFFKAKAYQKAFPIYLGGSLKKKFINGINSGIKYYTTQNVTINDFLENIYEKFSELSKTEVKKLIYLGFRRMHSSIKFGCAISIQTRKYIDCVAHIGAIHLQPEKQIKEYSIRRDKKLRKIEGWKKSPFDGYYYIGLNDTVFEDWVQQNKKSRTLLNFNNVMVRKIPEELYYKAKHIYIFKFKRKTFKGWLYWAEKLKLRDVEFIGEAYAHKFTPSTKTWKELIKEYETRKC